jgi:nicotinate-nucleotide pyrophosphorylase (carboxylating)
MSHTGLAEVEELIDRAGLDSAALALIVAETLAEDLGGRGVLPPGSGAGIDVTSVATIPAGDVARGEFVARQGGVVAGMPVAAFVVAVVCAPEGEFEIDIHRHDGATVARGDVLMTVSGNARALLRAERVALNLLTLMSGVATATRDWVRALAGTSTRVRDSRKTMPGLRMLQKYAVRVGGGVNHRMSLADAALIKDNHVIAAGGVVAAYRAVREAFPALEVEVEVTTIEQAREVIAAGATDILLDNMAVEQLSQVVAEMGDRATFEASGGLTLADAAEVARTGVDYVAVGAITHSPKILDIALDLTI